MLKTLFPGAWARAHAQGRQEGFAAALAEERARREAFDRRETLAQIGKPLIVISNEWDNPVIGFGQGLIMVGQSAVLTVENYLTRETVWCGGVVIDFSMQRLEICLALDPFQLWAITAHNAVGHDDFSKPRSGERWSKERILDTLRENGFFVRWAAFMEEAKKNQAPH